MNSSKYEVLNKLMSIEANKQCFDCGKYIKVN